MTRAYGNYVIFLIMGNAGFISSTVLLRYYYDDAYILLLLPLPLLLLLLLLLRLPMLLLLLQSVDSSAWSRETHQQFREEAPSGRRVVDQRSCA